MKKGNEMKIKRLMIGGLLSLAMAVTFIPNDVFAVPQEGAEAPEAVVLQGAEAPEAVVLQGEEAPGTVALQTEEVAIQTDMDLEEPDQLLQDYLQKHAKQQLAGKGAKSSKRKAPRSSRLDSDAENTLYRLMADMACEIAAGERADTKLTVSLNDLFEPMTAEKLGLETLTDDTGNLTGEAKEAYWDATYGAISNKAIIGALLADLPYELYWYDKSVQTGGTKISASYEFDLSDDGEMVEFYGGPDGSTSISDGSTLTYKLTVSGDFRPDGESDGYKVDTEKTSAASTAAETAATIVSDHKNDSDLEKLTSYKDTICEYTDYNEPAAENEDTPYGNPWQLIWVFDNDPKTMVVCEGYSKAFQFLCDLSVFRNRAVESHLVTGEMYGDEGAEGAGQHMWNVVHMDDGKNYLVDTTNCDEGSIGNPDWLFLKGYYDQEEDSYTFKCDEEAAKTLTFTYDPDTLGLYDEEELTLSGDDYKEAQQQPDDNAIEPDTSQEVTITRANEKVDFTFTPDHDGSYVFMSSGDRDTSARAYMAGHETEMPIAYDNDGGINENFLLVLDAKAGQTYTLRCGLLSEDETGSFIVTLTESTVADISYAFAENHTLIENYIGSWENEGEENEYFIYDLPEPEQGDALIVTDKNGTSETYTCSGRGDGDLVFVSESGKTIERELVHFYAKQNEQHWGVENDNNVDVTYMGVSTTARIIIKKSPVTGISFLRDGKAEADLMENRDGKWEVGYDDTHDIQTPYFEYEMQFQDGDVLTVTGAEELSGTYTWSDSEGGFCREDHLVVGRDNFVFSSNQSVKCQWENDEAPHYMTISYLGQRCKVKINIKNNPIEWIEYTGDPIVLTEGIDGKWVGPEENPDRYFEYEYDSGCLNENAKFTIGGDESVAGVYVYDEDKDAFVCDGHETKLDRQDFKPVAVDQSKNPWDVDDNIEVGWTYEGFLFDMPIKITHVHKWGEPTYEWAEDNSSVTATRVCENYQNHFETETVDTTSEVTKEETELADGERLYTATFTKEGFETQTKAEKIPAKGGQAATEAVADANTAIGKADVIDGSKYSTGSFAAVTKALAELKALLLDPKATVDQVKAATETLNTAMSSLKMDQTLNVKTKKVTVKVKKVRKKAQTVKPLTVTGQKTTVTYKGTPVGKKAKKALKINAKTGKITVRKKTKKGTYKMKVTVTAAASGKYEKAAKTVTVTIKVR